MTRVQEGKNHGRGIAATSSNGDYLDFLTDFRNNSHTFVLVVSTVFGIIIGPYVIGIFDPAGWKDFDLVTLEFTRIVIAVQVMAAGVSLPR